MLLALVVAAALEAAAAPATVEVIRSGSSGAAVSAAPRSLSDVAKELREGRRATGGFSAVETTVPREPVDLRSVAWEDIDGRDEPEVVPEPQPPGIVSNEIYGWGGGGWGPYAPRRRPHLAHFAGPGSRHGARTALRRDAAPANAPPRSGASRSVTPPVSPHAGPRSAPGSFGRRPG